MKPSKLIEIVAKFMQKHGDTDVGLNPMQSDKNSIHYPIEEFYTYTRVNDGGDKGIFDTCLALMPMRGYWYGLTLKITHRFVCMSATL